MVFMSILQKKAFVTSAGVRLFLKKKRFCGFLEDLFGFVFLCGCWSQNVYIPKGKNEENNV